MTTIASMLLAAGVPAEVTKLEFTGGEVVFNAADTAWTSCCYDSTNGKLVIAYQDIGNSYYGTAIVGTVSGDTISFGSEVVFNTGNASRISCCYDSTNGKVVIVWRDSTSSGTAIVGTVSGIGISFGSEVVFNADPIVNPSCCYDSTDSKVIIAYRDGGNSYYPTAIVGTVSGTGISFGAKTVFHNGGSQYIHCCFDSTNGKVVIAYHNSDNSNYGTAIVGTVSGTGISFGSATVFNSGYTDVISSTFDSTNGKVIIAYQDIGNSNYGTVIVGTVSGTGISFGSEVVFNNTSTYYISCCYDSTDSKVIIAYSDGGNSSYGTAIVGTVSGTGISFGSEVVFNAASAVDYYISCCYDSTNGKVIIAYRDGGNSSYGTAIVGTPIE